MQSPSNKSQQVNYIAVSRHNSALVSFELQCPCSRTFTTNLSDLRTPSPNGLLNDIHLAVADQQLWKPSQDSHTARCPHSLGTSSALMPRTDWVTSGYTSALAMLASQAEKRSRGVYPGRNGSSHRQKRTIRNARESGNTVSPPRAVKQRKKVNIVRQVIS